MELDHIVVAGETLEEAVAHVEGALGVAMQPGGQHVRYGTHNALMGLGDGLYLEAIAIDPSATPQDVPRWFGLDEFSGEPRVITWAARVKNLPKVLENYPVAGNCVEMQRGDLRWRMAVATDGLLPLGGAFPSLLEWQVTPIPGDILKPSGCTLQRLRVQSPVKVNSPPKVDAKASIQFATAPDLRIEAVFRSPDGEKVLT